MPAAVETMMYAGETPWHREGTRVGDDAVDAETAIVAAGLDWEVELRPVYQMNVEMIGDVEVEFPVEIPNAKSVTRVSDNRSFGIVSDRYAPIQNRAAFGFLDGLVGGEGLRYETAGALHDGRKVWMMAELTRDHFEPVKGDEMVPYLLLSNSHDGSGALRVNFTTVRVVCQNTLNLALRTSKGGVSIRHTGDIKARMREAESVLGLARKEIAAHAEWTETLAETRMTPEQWINILDYVIPVPEDVDPTRAKNKRSLLDELLHEGEGADMAPETFWAGLNAFTNYTSHHSTIRGAGGADADAKRLDAMWYGSGAALNRQAVKAVQKVMKTA